MAFYDILAETGAKFGIGLAVAQKFKCLIEEAGFGEAQEVVFDLPLGDFGEGRRMEGIGLFQQFQMTEGFTESPLAF